MTRLRGVLMASVTLLAAQSVAAQSSATDRGSFLVAGSASFSSNRTAGDDDRLTVLNVNPTIQYFVAPGVAVGASLGLGRASADNVTSTTIGIGPILTLYFNQVSPTVLPFISAEFNVSQTLIETQITDNDVTNTGIQGAAGLLLLLSNSVGINAQLFYRHLNVSAGDSDLDGNSYGLAFGISAFVF